MQALVVVLIALTAASLAAVGYRKFVTREEDDLLHVGQGSVQLTSKQETMAKTLEKLDMMIKVLISATVVFALGVGVYAIMQALDNTTVH